MTSLAPPKIVLEAAVKVDPGSKVPCSAIGALPIYIALIQNFTVLMNTTNTASSKLYQEGNYTCVATNKYGTDEKRFVIKGKKNKIWHTLILAHNRRRNIRIPSPEKDRNLYPRHFSCS